VRQPRDKVKHTAWVQNWQAARRAQGLCPRCGDGLLDINPRTLDYYWLCYKCRLKGAAESLRYYHAKRRAPKPKDPHAPTR